MTKIHIGQEIKQEVQKQNLTIEDFAKNLHLASSEIENIFNKKGEINNANLSFRLFNCLVPIVIIPSFINIL